MLPLQTVSGCFGTTPVAPCTLRVGVAPALSQGYAESRGLPVILQLKRSPTSSVGPSGFSLGALYVMLGIEGRIRLMYDRPQLLGASSEPGLRCVHDENVISAVVVR